jgi:hypothetical protein
MDKYNPYSYFKNYQPFMPFSSKEKDYFNDIISSILNPKSFEKRIENKECVKATVRKGNKVYSVVIKDITPEKEDIEITFEDDTPYHPDYTE